MSRKMMLTEIMITLSRMVDTEQRPGVPLTLLKCKVLLVSNIINIFPHIILFRSARASRIDFILILLACQIVEDLENMTLHLFVLFRSRTVLLMPGHWMQLITLLLKLNAPNYLPPPRHTPTQLIGAELSKVL